MTGLPARPVLAVVIAFVVGLGAASLGRGGADSSSAGPASTGTGLKLEAFAGEAQVIGSGGAGSSRVPGALDLARLAYAFTHGVDLRGAVTWFLGSPEWAPFGPPQVAGWPSRLRQTDTTPVLVSNGQFVWGPNAEDFDVAAYLEGRGSALSAYADDIVVWSDYSSVNPQVLLAVLEASDGMVDGSLAGMTDDEVRGRIGDTSIALGKAFYQHLYLWGDRRQGTEPPAGEPLVELGDGAIAAMSSSTSSGSYAVASVLAGQNDLASWQALISPQAVGGFAATFADLFPGVDPLDEANDINPPAAPPSDLLQFPFPLGAVWYFGGPHSWNGDSTPPFSSMDFYAGGGTCSAPPYLFSVAAASGATKHPSYYSCWIEIDHGGGWTTSYYHLINTHQGTSIARNGRMGTIDCQTCAGGYATGPHVHFSLKYNGSYVSLDGTRLSGWKVKVGNQAYYTGSIQRDVVTLPPFSQVVNDYQTYFITGYTSLRFNGNGTGDIDRVKIPVHVTGVANASPPIDIGWQDFTLEWWMKAAPGENTAATVTCGANINWIYGNTLFDRDRFNQDRKFGVSLAGGRIVFGVSGDGTGDLTLCSTTRVDDGKWHHIAVERNRWDGVLPDGYLWLFVDGKLQASAAGPRGDVSYPNNAVPGSFCGPSGTDPCTNDPYLVIGAEKHGLNPAVYPSFKGWIDEIRVSNALRYASDFTPPTTIFTPDTFTLAIYSFDEASGDLIFDTSGYPGGPSDGTRMFGGSPAGPAWSSDIAPLSYPTPTPTWTPGPSPTASRTPTPGPSATPTATPSATATATRTATSTPTPTPSATATVTASATSTPAAAASPAPSATASVTTTPGSGPGPADINQDGVVNVLDVQLCVNVFLGTQTDPGIVARADVNGDGAVNVLDVQAVVNTYLLG